MGIAVQQGRRYPASAERWQANPQFFHLRRQLHGQVTGVHGCCQPGCYSALPVELGPIIERRVVLPEVSPIAVRVVTEMVPLYGVDPRQGPAYLPPLRRSALDGMGRLHDEQGNVFGLGDGYDRRREHTGPLGKEAKSGGFPVELVASSSTFT